MDYLFFWRKKSPPPPPEFEKPWRIMNWNKKHEIEKNLRDFKLSNSDIEWVKILVSGPVGAGKSSFINSVNNVFQKRITSSAAVNSISGSSFTEVYDTHYIDGEDEVPLPFVFNDIMGLENGDGGAKVEDLIKALNGILQEGFNFSHVCSANKCTKDFCRRAPETKHQTFCLVNILPGDKISIMDQAVIKKMDKVRREAARLNIPQVVIMTRVDLTCPLVQKDLTKVYYSKKIKEVMEICSVRLGVPVNHIFPVKNYHEEMDTDNNIDALLLKALEQIVHIANDALKNEKRKKTEN